MCLRSSVYLSKYFCTVCTLTKSVLTSSADILSVADNKTRFLCGIYLHAGNRSLAERGIEQFWLNM